MGRLRKKKSSLCLFEAYLNNKISGGRQCAELLYVRVVSAATPRRMINDDFEPPTMGINNKDVTNVQLQDYDYDEEIELCTVTMLGVVMRWQPRVEDIKEVCLKSPHDYSIATAIHDACATHDRYSYLLLNIWANQLWAAGFWDDQKTPPRERKA